MTHLRLLLMNSLIKPKMNVCKIIFVNYMYNILKMFCNIILFFITSTDAELQKILNPPKKAKGTRKKPCCTNCKQPMKNHPKKKNGEFQCRVVLDQQ